MKSRQTGFTLVEIAIVLVIIGLLLGGVLKGQELITQAKIKNIANDFSGIAAAFYGYQDRYRKLPGDDNGAESRWSGTTKGDGNGVISGVFNSSRQDDEPRLFWQHLRLAGFITGDTTSQDQPNNAANGVVGVQNNAGPTGAALVGPVICSSNLLGKIAIAIDAQFDDGNPAKGGVRGFKQTGNVSIGGNNPTGSAAATSYADDGATLYTVCKTL